MIIQLLLIIFGLVLLVKGADWLVDGAAALASMYSISNFAIGLTIVAFGTSAPELVVNTFAAFNDHPSIVFANIIGSNIFNLFVILGISGLIASLVVRSNTVWREIPLSFFAIGFLFLLAILPGTDPVLSRFDGLLLFALFGLFVYYVIRQMKSDAPVEEYVPPEHSPARISTLLIIGLTCLVTGGKLVVSNAILIAGQLGVSEKAIGLTLVAAGTSLPELATSVTAILKKNNDIAVGNIIGSNIFNLLFILAVSAVVRPLNYDPLFNFDLLLLAGGTLFLFIAMFTGQKKKLDRWEAAVLLVVFLLYTINLIGKEI